MAGDSLHRLIPLLLLPVACASTDRHTGVQPHAEVCSARVLEVVGTDGSSPPSPIVDLLVRFTEPVEDDWNLQVMGVPADATLGADRLAAVVMPHTPLEPEQRYTLVATLCGQQAEVPVSTGPAPEEPPLSVLVPLDRVDWEAPGLDAWMAGLPAPDLAFVLDDLAYDPQVDVGVVVPDGLGLGRCGDFRPLMVDEVDPDCVGAGADHVALGVADRTLHFERLVVAATTDGHDHVAEVHLRGLLDTRSLPTTVADPCDRAARRSAPCAACADGEESCMPVDGTLAWPEQLDDDPRTALDVCR